MSSTTTRLAPVQPAAPRQAVKTTRLAGWGASMRADCVLVQPETPDEIAKFLDHAGTIARGLGRSYGDPALNAGGQVLGMSRVDRYLGFDETSGLLHCEAGVSLARIIQDLGPRGWFPMITPGTKYVTVGGCIANDVHGKAHHAQGSFASCVDAMTILLASGEVVPASRSENSDLFWGTLGGMGLLGVILRASIRLRRIETTYFRTRAMKLRNLEEMLAALDENDKSYPYSVANIDTLAKGTRLGSGVLSVGDHARAAELPANLAKDPLHIGGRALLKVPFELPEFALNRLTLPVANAFMMHTLMSKPTYSHYHDFFYPLDMFDDWNRAYGRRGFAQYQFVIPFEDGYRHLHALLDVIMNSGQLPFLNVLKRFGKESAGVLSFPREGFTFAIDFPMRDGLAALIRRLDAMVLEAGGRIYLGKDAFVDAATFRAMYPRVDEWLQIKKKYDPNNVFVSDLGRRVGLIPA